MGLARDIREVALRGGADFFGIANLAPARDAVVAQGGDAVAQFTRAVSIGMALPAEVVDRLAQHDDPGVARQYLRVYRETNRSLDRIAASVAERLRVAGAVALAVAASRRTDRKRLCGLFSHKLAAHLAGLGWIGRSCLLVTRGAGPRVRWTTVLTTAPLRATGGPIEPACGKCRRCVDACPARAFSGRPFRAEEPREVRFAARKCEDYVKARTQRTGGHVLCGLCVAACPHGKRHRNCPRHAASEGRRGGASSMDIV